jgi:hypothetical protein
MRRLNLISSSALMVALCTLLACGGQPQQNGEPTPDDPQSGGLESAPPTSEDPASDGQGDAADAPGNPAAAGKITICHIPPGNPANAHTITVGLPALKAHTKHGDTLGACGGETDAGTGGETDAGSGDVDAGPSECAPVGSTCGGGVVCCDGLTCGPEGYCEPIIG